MKKFLVFSILFCLGLTTSFSQDIASINDLSPNRTKVIGFSNQVNDHLTVNTTVVTNPSETTSSIGLKKGDFVVGVGSNLTNSIKDWYLTPTIGYMATDNIQVGGNMIFTKSESSTYNYVSVYVRYYPYNFKDNVRLYANINGGFSMEYNTNTFGLGAGITANLNKTFFIEPSLSYNYTTEATRNYYSFGTTLTAGLRF